MKEANSASLRSQWHRLRIQMCNSGYFLSYVRGLGTPYAPYTAYFWEVHMRDFIQLLDETEQNIVIYQWRADQLFADAEGRGK